MESAKAKGRKVPDWYSEKPEILPGDEFYFAEFWILDTLRQRSGGAIGPIPVPAVEERGEARHGFSDDVLELYVAVVRAMDDGYIEWQAAEFKRETSRETRKPAAPARARRR